MSQVQCFVLTVDALPVQTLPLKVLTSNSFMIGMLGVLTVAGFKLGLPMLLNLYIIPYWIFVVWLDVVTYLHHHGSNDVNERLPWYRGEVGSKESGEAGSSHGLYNSHMSLRMTRGRPECRMRMTAAVQVLMHTTAVYMDTETWSEA